MWYLENKRDFDEVHITHLNINNNDECNGLSLLYETNQKYLSMKNDLNNLIIKFVEENRGNNTPIMNKIHIGKDGFLGALRRIDWAYKIYIKSMQENNIEKNISVDEGDLRHIYCYTLFHNAKCLLEICKLISKSKLNKVFKDFEYKVTNLRNLFAHEYKKTIAGDYYFVSLYQNHYIEDIGIPEIQMYNIKNGTYHTSIHFSLPYVYQTIYNIINSLEIYHKQ